MHASYCCGRKKHLVTCMIIPVLTAAARKLNRKSLDGSVFTCLLNSILMFNLVTAKTKHWVFPLNKGTENQSELSFLSGFCHVLSDCEAWILSIMAVFLYKCLLQVITRWLCSKSLQLSVDRFFWGRDNCSFLQRKLSHRHTMPKPLASLSKPCVQSRGRILFETFGLEKLVWKWTQFFL
jgi:hypothetical protein